MGFEGALAGVFASAFEDAIGDAHDSLIFGVFVVVVFTLAVRSGSVKVAAFEEPAEMAEVAVFDDSSESSLDEVSSSGLEDDDEIGVFLQRFFPAASIDARVAFNGAGQVDGESQGGTSGDALDDLEGDYWVVIIHTFLTRSRTSASQR